MVQVASRRVVRGLFVAGSNFSSNGRAVSVVPSLGVRAARRSTRR